MSGILYFILNGFCPLCVGIAVSGSALSRFIPGVKMYLINSLWVGYFMFTVVKYVYDRFSFLILKQRTKITQLLLWLLLILVILCFYFGFILVIYFLNARSLEYSWIFAYNTGFFAGLLMYEVYNLLFEKGIKIKYGSVTLPVLLAFLLSIVYYLI